MKNIHYPYFLLDIKKYIEGLDNIAKYNKIDII